jgi:hypothetical protein
MNPRLSLATLAFLATLAVPAFAQNGTAGQSFAVPANPCVAPKFPDKPENSTELHRADAINNYNKLVQKFNVDNKAYGECIKKYVEDSKVWVKEVADAANKAIDEYNKYNANLKEKLAEDKQ